MPKQPYLSVIIPSYNEVKNINRGVLDQILEYLRHQPYTWELILSDDGSSDGTAPLLEAFAQKKTNVKVIKNVHAGKGPTVKAGMLAATGRWRLFSDFDQSTPLKEVEKLWPYAEEGYGVIIGSREIKGAKRDKEPLHRHIMGRGFNMLVQLLAIPGIQDTQCGFKMFSEKAAVELFSKLVVYGQPAVRPDAFTGAFDVEALYLARKYNYSIKEVPILWQHNETDRVNPIKDSVRMLLDILRVRLTDILGKYQSFR